MSDTTDIKILLTLQDEATEKLKRLNETIQENTKSIKTFGIECTVFGAAITAALTLSVMSAESSRESQARLAKAIENTGVSYDLVQGQIGALIAKEMSLTSYSENDMYNALNRLVIITGNYSNAMSALPVALDLAAAGNIDLTTAARYTGDAFEGFSTRLKMMYGIDIPQGVSGMEALRYVMAKVQGQAEATANPFVQFKNTTNLLAQDLGNVLLPALTTVIENISNFVAGFMNWLDRYPAIKDTFVVIASVVGIASTAIGLTALAIVSKLIPSLIAGATAIWAYVAALYAQVVAQVAVYVAMGPVGWAILAGMAAATAVAVLAVKSIISSLTDEAAAATAANVALEDLGDTTSKLLPSGRTLQQARGGTTTNYPYPSYQHGGVVPGPIGASVPIIAHGGERYLGSGGTEGTGDITVNVNVAGHVMTEKNLTQIIREQLFSFMRYNGGHSGIAV